MSLKTQLAEAQEYVLKVEGELSAARKRVQELQDAIGEELKSGKRRKRVHHERLSGILKSLGENQSKLVECIEQDDEFHLFIVSSVESPWSRGYQGLNHVGFKYARQVIEVHQNWDMLSVTIDRKAIQLSEEQYQWIGVMSELLCARLREMDEETPSSLECIEEADTLQFLKSTTWYKYFQQHQRGCKRPANKCSECRHIEHNVLIGQYYRLAHMRAATRLRSETPDLWEELIHKRGWDRLTVVIMLSVAIVRESRRLGRGMDVGLIDTDKTSSYDKAGVEEFAQPYPRPFADVAALDAYISRLPGPPLKKLSDEE